MGNSAFIILVALAKTYYLEVNIMNKTELIGALAAKTGMTRKDSEKALTAILDTIVTTLQNGENVQIVGFGNFEVRERAARIGHNPTRGNPDCCQQGPRLQSRQVLQGRYQVIIV